MQFYTQNQEHLADKCTDAPCIVGARRQYVYSHYKDVLYNITIGFFLIEIYFDFLTIKQQTGNQKQIKL